MNRSSYFCALCPASSALRVKGCSESRRVPGKRKSKYSVLGEMLKIEVHRSMLKSRQYKNNNRMLS